MRDGNTISAKWIMLTRIVRAGVKNLFRNAWLSLAAIAVMLVALSIISLAIVLNVTARNAIGEYSKNLKVSIYLFDDVSESDRNGLQQSLENNEYTASVDYTSKQDALTIFTERQNSEEDEAVLQGISLAGDDTFPASFEVSVSDLSKMSEIESVARQEAYKEVVEDVSLGKTETRNTIERAASVQGFITTASIISAIIFTIVSVLIIFNTIRMAIFTRAEEIRIMKLIGATPNYIRGPFLVEASLYGVIAGIIAISVIYSFILLIGSKFASQAEFSETYELFTETPVIAAMFIGSTFVGILVGVFSSALAMEKHLKLKHW